MHVDVYREPFQGLARPVRSPARPALNKLLERTPYRAAPKGESRNRVGVAQGHESGRPAFLVAHDPQATDVRPTARSRDKPRTAARGFGKGLPLRSLLLPLALPRSWASPLSSWSSSSRRDATRAPSCTHDGAKPKALSVLVGCRLSCFHLRGVKGGDWSMGRAPSRHDGGGGASAITATARRPGARAVDTLSPGAALCLLMLMICPFPQWNASPRGCAPSCGCKLSPSVTRGIR